MRAILAKVEKFCSMPSPVWASWHRVAMSLGGAAVHNHAECLDLLRSLLQTEADLVMDSLGSWDLNSPVLIKIMIISNGNINNNNGNSNSSNNNSLHICLL